MVVGRQPVFPVLVGLDVEIGDDGRLAGHRLNDLGVETQAFVGVGQVARRGHQETKLGGRLRRPHENTIYSSAMPVPGPIRSRIA